MSMPIPASPAGARRLPGTQIVDRIHSTSPQPVNIHHLAAELPFQAWLSTELATALCVAPQHGSLSIATTISQIRWPDLIEEHPEQLWAPHNPATDPPGLTWDVIASIWRHLDQANIRPWMRADLYWMGGQCAAIRPLLLAIEPGPVPASAVQHMLDTADRSRGIEPGPPLSDDDLQLGWQVLLWP